MADPWSREEVEARIRRLWMAMQNRLPEGQEPEPFEDYRERVELFIPAGDSGGIAAVADAGMEAGVRKRVWVDLYCPGALPRLDWFDFLQAACLADPDIAELFVSVDPSDDRSTSLGLVERYGFRHVQDDVYGLFLREPRS